MPITRGQVEAVERARAANAESQKKMLAELSITPEERVLRFLNGRPDEYFTEEEITGAVYPGSMEIGALLFSALLVAATEREINYGPTAVAKAVKRLTEQNKISVFKDDYGQVHYSARVPLNPPQ